MPTALSADIIVRKIKKQKLDIKKLLVSYINLKDLDAFDELTYCLVVYSPPITLLRLGVCELSFTAFTNITRFLSNSQTIKHFDLFCDKFENQYYAGLATALHINTSITTVYLESNTLVDSTKIDVSYVNALRYNPCRPEWSDWRLYKNDENWHDTEFYQLCAMRDTMAPPSMLEFLLYAHFYFENTELAKRKIHRDVLCCSTLH